MRDKAVSVFAGGIKRSSYVYRHYPNLNSKVVAEPTNKAPVSDVVRNRCAAELFNYFLYNIISNRLGKPSEGGIVFMTQR